MLIVFTKCSVTSDLEDYVGLHLQTSRSILNNLSFKCFRGNHLRMSGCRAAKGIWRRVDGVISGLRVSEPSVRAWHSQRIVLRVTLVSVFTASKYITEFYLHQMYAIILLLIAGVTISQNNASRSSLNNTYDDKRYPVYSSTSVILRLFIDPFHKYYFQQCSSVTYVNLINPFYFNDIIACIHDLEKNCNYIHLKIN